LIDIAGLMVKRIYEGFVEEDIFSKTINTDDLVKGVYFLKILTNKEYTVKKIIIN